MYVSGHFFYGKENQGIFTNDEKTPWSKEQWMILVIFVKQKTNADKNFTFFVVWLVWGLLFMVLDCDLRWLQIFWVYIYY